jgi:hypothetical protein
MQSVNMCRVSICAECQYVPSVMCAEYHKSDLYAERCYAECHYAECRAECHYAECYYAECHYAKYCGAFI